MSGHGVQQTDVIDQNTSSAVRDSRVGMVGLIGCLIFVALSFSAVRSIQCGRESSKWPSVDGVILTSRVVSAEDSDATDLSYSYQVDG
jgi:hypothetical protein